MSFYATSFLFDGIPCEHFGLMLANISSSKQEAGVFAKHDIQEERIAGRHEGLHYGVLSNEPLSFSITMVSVNDGAYFDRYDAARVSSWLTGYQDYKSLVLCQPDMEQVSFHCIITELRAVEVGMRIVGYTADVRCDAPYAYRHMSDDVLIGSGLRLYHNQSNWNGLYRPVIKIESSGTFVSIQNKTTGGIFTLSGMMTSDNVISVDCMNQILDGSDGTNLYECWNIGIKKCFPAFVRGDNLLEISGASSVTIQNDLPWNIGF